MFNRKIKVFKSFFKKISYSNLIREINLHKNKNIKILKRKKMTTNNSGLNFFNTEYKELMSILTQINNFNEFGKFFNSKIILNNCSIVTLNPAKKNYTRSSTWHRDIKYFNKYAKAEMLLLIVPVTPCTKKNGATMFKVKNKIIQPEINLDDILVADARILHKGGINLSNYDRTILTICITPPHIKPIFNFEHKIKNPTKTEESIKQIAGYFSRVPNNNNQFFQKNEKKRFFLKDQFY